MRLSPPAENFNTSHVSINLCGPLREKRSEAHFNTSHISINHDNVIRFALHIYISIHLMFLLITEILKRYPYWTVISIHLMFLLIKPDIAGKELQRHISIHLMFLLIFAFLLRQ